MRTTRWTLLALTLAVLLLAPAMSAQKVGIGGAAVDNGCVCHSPSVSSDATVTVTGLPDTWNASTTYSLTITVDGTASTDATVANGGFNFRASKGTIVITDTTNTQLMEGQATHTEAGNKLRTWDVDWTAPSDDDARVQFTVFGNAANGDDTASADDEWNRFDSTIEGAGYGDSEDSPGFGAALAMIGLLGAVLVLARRKSE